MGVTKNKYCDRCGVDSTQDFVIRSYRWMRLMDNYHYKHSMLVKVDLCDQCANMIHLQIEDFIHNQG